MAEAIEFVGWAIIELMGHRQRAGYVKDIDMFGGKMLKIDIPYGPVDVVTGQGSVTEFYGCAAVYALRPCTEELVRLHNKRTYGEGDPRPVRQLDYRPASDPHDGDEE